MKKNLLEICSKSAQRFIKTFKNEAYKCMSSVSNNLYIDNLGEIVSKIQQPCECKIKTIYLPWKKVIIKILSLKLVVIWEYWNIKRFLQKVTFQIDPKFLLL